MRLLQIVFVLQLCLAAGCTNDIATINKISDKKEAAVETSEDIEIIYSSEAKVRARLTAPLLKRYDVKFPYSEFNNGLTVDFYDEHLKPMSKLTAGYGRIDEHENTMVVRNDVRVVNSKNEKLNTEELFWNNKTRKIYSEKHVVIQTADELIYGEGLEANEDLTNYKIKKISGTVNLKENPLK